MKRYFIYYNNNYFESSDSMNITLLHMIDNNVIRVIVDTKENKAWIRGDEGIAKEITIPSISGL